MIHRTESTSTRFLCGLLPHASAFASQSAAMRSRASRGVTRSGSLLGMGDTLPLSVERQLVLWDGLRAQVPHPDRPHGVHRGRRAHRTPRLPSRTSTRPRCPAPSSTPASAKPDTATSSPSTSAKSPSTSSPPTPTAGTRRMKTSTSQRCCPLLGEALGMARDRRSWQWTRADAEHRGRAPQLSSRPPEQWLPELMAAPRRDPDHDPHLPRHAPLALPTLRPRPRLARQTRMRQRRMHLQSPRHRHRTPPHPVRLDPGA
jgi:hypothetical protein